MEHLLKKKCPKCETVMHYNDLTTDWLICHKYICHKCGHEERNFKYMEKLKPDERK